MMRRIYDKLFLLVIVIALAGCGHHLESRADILSYIHDPDNGLIQTRQIGDVKVSLSYLPARLLLKDKVGEHRDALSKLKDKYFFVLSFSKNDRELLAQLDRGEYSELIQVLSFRMQPNIEVITNRQEYFEPLDCLFQQTFGLANANELLIVFNSRKLESSNAFKINIKEFGLELGNLSFEFQQSYIKYFSEII